LAVYGRTLVWLGSGGGPAARVFASLNAGRPFRAIPSPVTAGTSTRGIFGLAFRTPREGLAVGPGGSDESFDNGRTWRPFSLDGCHVVTFAPDGKFGWAAGNKGKIVRIAVN